MNHIQESNKTHNGSIGFNIGSTKTTAVSKVKQKKTKKSKNNESEKQNSNYV
jgi:hypothetical protein